MKTEEIEKRLNAFESKLNQGVNKIVGLIDEAKQLLKQAQDSLSLEGQKEKKQVPFITEMTGKGYHIYSEGTRKYWKKNIDCHTEDTFVLIDCNDQLPTSKGDLIQVTLCVYDEEAISFKTQFDLILRNQITI